MSIKDYVGCTYRQESSDPRFTAIEIAGFRAGIGYLFINRNAKPVNFALTISKSARIWDPNEKDFPILGAYVVFPVLMFKDTSGAIYLMEEILEHLTPELKKSFDQIIEREVEFIQKKAEKAIQNRKATKEE